MGRKVGDQAWVDAETGRYCVEIVSIEKGKDDESLPISSFLSDKERAAFLDTAARLFHTNFMRRAPSQRGARSVIIGETGGNA